MCGFCHAPEHAYDMLLEHPEIERDGLCPDAQERLLMAAAPEPPEEPGMLYGWSTTEHAWLKWRESGLCAQCGARTWRYANETAPHECRPCQRAYIDTINLGLQEQTGQKLTKEEIAHLLTGHPRQQSPIQGNPLVFSDYEVTNTKHFEGLPGPRYGMPRPRIVFGEAVLAVRTLRRGTQNPRSSHEEE